MSQAGGRQYYCFVPKCNSTTRANPGKRFICVPQNTKKRRLWWRAARRDFPMQDYAVYCCEDHFNLEEDAANYFYVMMMGGKIRLKEGVVPHKFECQGRQKPQNEKRASLVRKRIIHELLEDKENLLDTSLSVSSEGNSKAEEDTSHICEPPIKHVGVQVRMPVRSKAVQVSVVPQRVDAASSTTEFSIENDWSASPHGSTSGDEDVNCDNSKTYEPSETDESEVDVTSLSLLVTRQHIMNSPMKYIGLQKEHLDIVNALSAKIQYRERGQALTKNDVVSLILMRIRTGISSTIIADMFGVAASWVSRMLSRHIPVLASCLKGLIRWPPSEVIKDNLPHAFKVYYHRVETIIDCFEIEIEKPSAAMLQSMSWSSYKKCNTVKYLISATPDGLVNFVSSGRPGRCSDMELLRESGYLECLREGVTVLADRGFKEIETELTARGCRLVRPVSVKKDEQLCARDVLNMKVVAALRIHIERVIRRVRLYKFLSMHACVPLTMVDLLDDVVKIACGLINIQERIVKV